MRTGTKPRTEAPRCADSVAAPAECLGQPLRSGMSCAGSCAVLRGSPIGGLRRPVARLILSTNAPPMGPILLRADASLMRALAGEKRDTTRISTSGSRQRRLLTHATKAPSCS